MIEADGTFYMTKNKRHAKKPMPCFSITQLKDSSHVLEKLCEYFIHGDKNLYYVKRDNTCRLQICGVKRSIEIIKHFTKYPLKGCKHNSFLHYKYIAENVLISNYEYDYYLLLKNKFSLIVSKSSSEVDPWYLTGLVDGDGGFHINFRENLSINFRFTVCALKTSKNILDTTQNYFSCGYIEIMSSVLLRYNIENIHDLKTYVIPHFDNYPLQTKKFEHYQVWKQVLLKYLDYRIKYPQGAHTKDIRLQKKSMLKKCVLLGYNINQKGKRRSKTLVEYLKLINEMKV